MCILQYKVDALKMIITYVYFYLHLDKNIYSNTSIGLYLFYILILYVTMNIMGPSCEFIYSILIRLFAFSKN